MAMRNSTATQIVERVWNKIENVYPTVKEAVLFTTLLFVLMIQAVLFSVVADLSGWSRSDLSPLLTMYSVVGYSFILVMLFGLTIYIKKVGERLVR